MLNKVLVIKPNDLSKEENALWSRLSVLLRTRSFAMEMMENVPNSAAGMKTLEDAMWKVDGVILFGSRVPGVPEKGKQLADPWHSFEAGMAYTHSLPLLMVGKQGTGGIFDLKETNRLIYQIDPTSSEQAVYQIFCNWVTQVYISKGPIADCLS